MCVPAYRSKHCAWNWWCRLTDRRYVTCNRVKRQTDVIFKTAISQTLTVYGNLRMGARREFWRKARIWDDQEPKVRSEAPESQSAVECRWGWGLRVGAIALPSIGSRGYASEKHFKFLRWNKCFCAFWNGEMVNGWWQYQLPRGIQLPLLGLPAGAHEGQYIIRYIKQKWRTEFWKLQGVCLIEFSALIWVAHFRRQVQN